MMKWFGNIFFLLLIWFICSAKGCNENAINSELMAERRISAEKDSIRQVFEVANPGEKLLTAYGETAIQKLIDFADYLKIASDSSNDKAFRLKATEMAGKLFLSQRSSVSEWSKLYPQQGIKTTDSLFMKCLANQMSLWIQPVQIVVNKSLTLKNDSVYEGDLSFYPQLLTFEKQNLPVKISELLAVDFYALKKVKHFGKESLTVWEVRLGDIKAGNRTQPVYNN
jgi:hypothetical protein